MARREGRLMGASHMRIVLLVIGLLGINSSMAIAQSWNGSYYCVEEAAGGLEYDATTNQLKGVGFIPDEKFVLRLEYVSRREEPHLEPPITIDDYKVTITLTGKSQSQSLIMCLKGNDMVGYDSFVGISYGRVEQCWLGEKEYHFNLRSGRFVSVYYNDWGYLFGDDKVNDTPSINAGTCTKIN
jgi:hypothetical protein